MTSLWIDFEVSATLAAGFLLATNVKISTARSVCATVGRFRFLGCYCLLNDDVLTADVCAMRTLRTASSNITCWNKNPHWSMNAIMAFAQRYHHSNVRPQSPSERHATIQA